MISFPRFFLSRQQTEYCARLFTGSTLDHSRNNSSQFRCSALVKQDKKPFRAQESWEILWNKYTLTIFVEPWASEAQLLFAPVCSICVRRVRWTAKSCWEKKFLLSNSLVLREPCDSLNQKKHCVRFAFSSNLWREPTHVPVKSKHGAHCVRNWPKRRSPNVPSNSVSDSMFVFWAFESRTRLAYCWEQREIGWVRNVVEVSQMCGKENTRQPPIFVESWLLVASLVSLVSQTKD